MTINETPTADHWAQLARQATRVANSDGEDAMADVRMQLLAGRFEDATDTDLARLLATSVKHRAIDLIRRRQNRSRRELNWAIEAERGHESSIHEVELRVAVASITARLRAKDVLLVRALMCGMSIEEAASTAGLTRHQARHRREGLRSAFTELDPRRPSRAEKAA